MVSTKDFPFQERRYNVRRPPASTRTSRPSTRKAAAWCAARSRSITSAMGAARRLAPSRIASAVTAPMRLRRVRLTRRCVHSEVDLALGAPGDLRIVSHNQECHAPLRLKAAQQVQDLGRAFAVQVSRWLIRQKDLRPVGKAAGNGHPLALAGRGNSLGY